MLLDPSQGSPGWPENYAISFSDSFTLTFFNVASPKGIVMPGGDDSPTKEG